MVNRKKRQHIHWSMITTSYCGRQEEPAILISRLDLTKNERNTQNAIWSRVDRPSTPRTLITNVLTICHVKLTQSTALEQKRLDLRSLSSALSNLYYLLVWQFYILYTKLQCSHEYSCKCTLLTLAMTETVRRKIILTVYGYKNLHICQAKFVENEPSEICSHLSEMGPKGRFLCADIFENHTCRGRGKGEKKSEEDEKKRREN